MKSVKQSDVMFGHWFTEYYLKSEADKVIADKDNEIEDLKKQVHDYAQGLYVIQARAEKELHQQKRKRCLAMKKLCAFELDNAFRDPCISRSAEGCKRWRRWLNIWRELANEPTWQNFLILLRIESDMG